MTSVGIRFHDDQGNIAGQPNGLRRVLLPSTMAAGDGDDGQGTTDNPADQTTPTEAEQRANRETLGLFAILRSLHGLKQHNAAGFADCCETATGLFDDDVGEGATATLLADFVLAFASVTPDHATESTATPITIAGTGFRSGATVEIGGEPCTSIIVVSPTQITCTTPADLAAGDYNIVIANPSGDPVTATAGWTSDPA